VEKVNESLAGEHRSEALSFLDGKIAEANATLDAAQADVNLRSSVLKPLEQLKVQLAALVSIPRILYLRGQAGELLDNVMVRIAEAAKAKMQEQSQGKPPAPGLFPSGGASSTSATSGASSPIKPIKVIHPAELGNKTYLETTEDVDEYVDKLRAALLAAIGAGQRARIQ
jgi:hypothetical protein